MFLTADTNLLTDFFRNASAFLFSSSPTDKPHIGSERRQLRKRQASSNGLHQHAAPGTGTRVHLQHVPVQVTADRDRHLPELIRKTGQDLVPKPTRQIQEGKQRIRTETASLPLFPQAERQRDDHGCRQVEVRQLRTTVARQGQRRRRGKRMQFLAGLGGRLRPRSHDGLRERRLIAPCLQALPRTVSLD